MRKKLFHLFSILSYYCGLDAIFYWLNRKAKRVLCFHHVMPDGMVLRMPLDGFAITASQFRQIIMEVQRRFQISTDIDDPCSVTITFDDGFLNQYEVAADALKGMNVPACLFVAGKMIDMKEPKSALDCDLLAAWATFAPQGDYTLSINGDSRHFAIRNFSDRRHV